MSNVEQVYTMHLSADGKWLCTLQHCDGVHHYYVSHASAHPR